MSTGRDDSQPAPTVCLINIGPRQRRIRMWSGIIGIGIGIALGVAMIVIDAPRWARVGLFLPYLSGAVGIFQARGKT